MKKYLTAKEVFKKYPRIEKELCWGKRDLVHFTKRKILEGRHHRSRQVSVIDENSLLKLLDYVNSFLENNPKNGLKNDIKTT